MAAHKYRYRRCWMVFYHPRTATITQPLSVFYFSSSFPVGWLQGKKTILYHMAKWCNRGLVTVVCVCVHMLDGADAPHRIGLGSFELEWCGSVCVCVSVLSVVCLRCSAAHSFNVRSFEAHIAGTRPNSNRSIRHVANAYGLMWLGALFGICGYFEFEYTEYMHWTLWAFRVSIVVVVPTLLIFVYNTM